MFLDIIRYSYFLYSLYRVSKTKNEENINRLIKSTKKCGVLATKLLQFILMRGNELNDSRLHYVFEDCDKHSFEYTQQVYLEEFGKDIFNDYIIENTDPIASGSIGQVYKFYSKLLNTHVAIKVKHPKLNERVIHFIKVIKVVCFLCKWFNKYHYMIIEYIDNIQKQLDYIEEAENTIKFRYKWKSEKSIIIPEVFEYTDNFIIMEYHEGKNYNELPDDKKLIVSLYMNFIFYTSFLIHDFVHGDLHTGNWKVICEGDQLQIILYDCGIMCSTNDFEYNKKMICNLFGGSFENLLYLVSNKDHGHSEIRKCKKIIENLHELSAGESLRVFIDTVLSMKLISNKKSINVLNAFAIIAEIYRPAADTFNKYTKDSNDYQIIMYFYLGILRNLKLFDELYVFLDNWMKSDAVHEKIYSDWLFELLGHKNGHILDTIVYRKIFKNNQLL